MRLFSHRIGKKAIPTIIQRESADDRLRTDLWNLLTSNYLGFWRDWLPESQTPYWSLAKSIWTEYYGGKLDEINYNRTNLLDTIKFDFFESEWNEMFDILEFIPNVFDENSVIRPVILQTKNQSFIFDANKMLEKNLSAYRFIQGRVTEISDTEEVSSVQGALQNSFKIAPVKIHLTRALELYSDRENPNYRNSINESICAIEAFCKIITKDAKATLGQAIKEVEKKHRLHPALKTAISNLYGYTSDESGIRHALYDEPNLKQEDARFMLVICSSFINYLIVKTDTAIK
jgi:hypothetical protein